MYIYNVCVWPVTEFIRYQDNRRGIETKSRKLHERANIKKHTKQPEKAVLVPFDCTNFVYRLNLDQKFNDLVPSRFVEVLHK